LKHSGCPSIDLTKNLHVNKTQTNRAVNKS
jgi:hypothetical protein